MGSLIDKDALIKKYKERKKLFCKNQIEFRMLSDKDKARVDELDNCIADVMNMPTIEPERKTGQWIFDENDFMTKCSECGCHPWFGVIPTAKGATKKLPHCPVCLAKMEGEG